VREKPSTTPSDDQSEKEYRNVIERQELAGMVVFAVVGVVLVALAPAKHLVERALVVCA
jgi:hypothetical protein